MNKSQIRKIILKKRKEKFLENFPFNKNKLLNFLTNLKFKNKNIGGYYPYNYELDILEILKFLQDRKFKISLPKIQKNNQMNFFGWSFAEPLLINKYGIPEPTSEKQVFPDVLFMPLVAFDNDLNRLGYGGGYYDRYLSKNKKIKKILKIGIAYSFQKVKKIPIDKHDIRLDHIITERKFY